MSERGRRGSSAGSLEEDGSSKGVRGSQNFKQQLDTLQKGGRRGSVAQRPTAATIVSRDVDRKNDDDRCVAPGRSVLEKLLNKQDAELESRLARSTSERRMSGGAVAPRRASMSIVIDRRGSTGGLDMSPKDSGQSSPLRAGGPRRPSLGERVRRASTDRALGSGADATPPSGGDVDPLSAAAAAHRLKAGGAAAGPAKAAGDRSSDERRRPSLTGTRRASASSVDGGVRERRRSKTNMESPPRGAEGRQFDDPALELEYLRLQNEDLASALRAEQAANADLRKAVQVLEDENNSLREYMNDRLV